MDDRRVLDGTLSGGGSAKQKRRSGGCAGAEEDCPPVDWLHERVPLD
jgi:hypothetical protein